MIVNKPGIRHRLAVKLAAMRITSKIVFILTGFLIIASCRPENNQGKREKDSIRNSRSVSLNPELQPLDIPSLEEHLDGLKGTKQQGMYKITVPQNDLNVNVDGFRIIPPMGLGSWITFAPAAGGAIIMGDIVVTETDLGPVEQEIIRQGLSITAIHNHFLRDKPHVMYMHIGGTGDQNALAQSVKSVFDKIAEVRGGDPAAGQAATVENNLDTAMISRIIGHSGSMNRGVYKITIARPDVRLVSMGNPVNAFMGFNTWASWQGTPDHAAVAGDFTMLTGEVQPVINALISNGFEVVALHNHMIHENPRIFFLHYWGTGPAENLAEGLKAALDKTAAK